MPRPNFTDVTILLDRSGSMQSIREAVIEGVNGFVRSQQELPGDVAFTLMQFDDPRTAVANGEGFPHVVYESRRTPPVITQADFVPRGSTGYYHAACLAVDMTGARLARMPEHERPSGVMFVIMTDGYDNRAFPGMLLGNLRDRVSHQRSKYNWEFIFLGANIDAYAIGGAMEVKTANILNYDFSPEGVAVAMDFAHANTKAYRTANATP